MPLFGNIFQIRTSKIHLQFEQWARQHGPMYRVQLGLTRAVVVSDHQVIAAILRERPDGYSRTARLEEIGSEMGLPGGVFSANGESWRRQRRMVMAAFDPSHIRNYFSALQQVARRLDARWQKAATLGATIDLQNDLMRYTVDTIAGLAFGVEVHTLESDQDAIQQHLNQIFPALFQRILSPFPTWRWFRTASVRRLDHSIREVMRAVGGFVAQARARMAANPDLHQQPGNLLEAMLAAADQPGSGMDDNLVAGNVLTMLLAGEDTTANTLAWMLHLLWQNPQALEKACAEVRAVCQPGKAPTVEQLAALDYVEACANETMRLKPVAPWLPLQALRPVAIGDVQLPPGTLVINLMRHDAVSEGHVAQAAQFQPERWLAAGDAARMGQSAKRISMPFGAGPRICPGRYLALLEIKMAIATLLVGFDIEHVGTADGREPEEHMAFTVAPVGLQMRLRRRSNGPGQA